MNVLADGLEKTNKQNLTELIETFMVPWATRKSKLPMQIHLKGKFFYENFFFFNVLERLDWIFFFKDIFLCLHKSIFQKFTLLNLNVFCSFSTSNP